MCPKSGPKIHPKFGPKLHASLPEILPENPPEISPEICPEVRPRKFYACFKGVWDPRNFAPPKFHINFHAQRRPISPTKTAGAAHSPGPFLQHAPDETNSFAQGSESRTARIGLLAQGPRPAERASTNSGGYKQATSFGHKCPDSGMRTIGILATQEYRWPRSAVLNGLANEIRRNPLLPQPPLHIPGKKT